MGRGVTLRAPGSWQYGSLARVRTQGDASTSLTDDHYYPPGGVAVGTGGGVAVGAGGGVAVGFGTGVAVGLGTGVAVGFGACVALGVTPGVTPGTTWL